MSSCCGNYSRVETIRGNMVFENPDLILYWFNDSVIDFITKLGWVRQIVVKNNIQCTQWDQKLYVVFIVSTKKTSVTIMCRNDELSSTMSWVGCLLADSVLPDTWKLRDWE